jgi:hypothetical protein
VEIPNVATIETTHGTEVTPGPSRMNHCRTICAGSGAPAPTRSKARFAGHLDPITS